MLQYDFMIYAIIAGIILAIIIPLLGNVIVFKRLANLGDSLSHISLAGVAMGLFYNINPLISALIFTILVASSLEFFRKYFKNYSELSTSIIMAIGVAIAGIYSSFLPTGTSLESFLFGSLVSVSKQEIILIIIIFIIVISIFIKYYHEFMYVCFDEESAKSSGVNVKLINFMFILITASVIAIASKIMGALVVSSLLILPVSNALIVSKSFKSNIMYSIIFAMTAILIGITVSYYVDLKPGSTIITISLILLFTTMFGKKLITIKRT